LVTLLFEGILVPIPFRGVDIADLAIRSDTGELAVEGHQPAIRAVVLRRVHDRPVESVARFDERPARGFELGNQLLVTLSFQAKQLRGCPQLPGCFPDAKLLQRLPEAIDNVIVSACEKEVVQTVAGSVVTPAFLMAWSIGDILFIPGEAPDMKP